MKPIDFNNIGQQLNNAQKKPSDNAWKSMEALLNQYKSKPNYLYKIAAVLVLFFAITVVYLSKTDSKTNIVPQFEVVVHEALRLEQKTYNNVDKNKDNSEYLVAKKESSIRQNIPKNEVIVEKVHQDDTSKIFNNINKLTEESMSSKQEDVLTNDLINQTKKNHYKVNPDYLLQVVEQELNAEHTNKTFRTIEQKIKDLKESITNRNNEP